MLNPGVDLLMAENWDAAMMQFYQEFYETTEEPLPELTSVFPEEPVDASLNAQDEHVAAAISESSQYIPAPVKAPKQKVRGFGVVGVTAVSLAAILVAVVLGTFAVTKRKD
jgi:hypothetical protein